MGSAMHLVFPAAIIGSLILASFGYSVMARIPVELRSNTDPQEVVSDIQVTETEISPDQAVSSDTQENQGGPGENSNCKVSNKFPENITQWCGLITKQAERTNLDPDLLAALIWQESGGNPSAYSKSGAVGLMQVMPRDGLAASFMCINGPCFTNRPSIQELQDPQFNVKYGSGMLAGLVSKYGDTREALKRYGPMDVGYYYADKVLGIFNNYRR